MLERIGKYEILGELGRGGMGAVYKARDPIIGREVAIKVILKSLVDSDEVKRRFYREARSAGQLSHDNITVIYEVNEHEGQPYLVMEYLDGVNLRERLLSQAPLTFEDRLEIACQICRGLGYAHDHGVIHRDIKPPNISVLSNGRVKIMDFGIARIQGESQTLTQTNMSLGTPRYMSPEQIRGETLDGRSDIFAFGVLFYELLTGANPFAGEHITTVIYKVLNEPPPPLSFPSGVLTRRLEDIVNKCLAKDREQRYRDCGAVEVALRAVIEEEDRAVLSSVPGAIAAAGLVAEEANPDETMPAAPAKPTFEEETVLLSDSPPRQEARRPTPKRTPKPRTPKPRTSEPRRSPKPKPTPEPKQVSTPPPASTSKKAKKKTPIRTYALATLGILLAASVVVAGYLALQGGGLDSSLSDTTQQENTTTAQDETEGTSNEQNASDATDTPLGIAITPDNTASTSEGRPAPSTSPSGGGEDRGQTRPGAGAGEAVGDEAARRAAEQARDAVQQARERVKDRGTEPEVVALFTRANMQQQTGTERFSAGDFAAATGAFREATTLFGQVRGALEAKDQAATAANTGEAAEIVTIEGKTREDAEAARATMQTAKDKVASNLRKAPVYQEALSLEGQGTQFSGAKLYSRAFGRYNEAKAKYEQAATASTASTVSSELQASVDSFIQTLKTNIDQEDGNGMRAMFYRDRDWSAFFEKAEAVAAVVSPGTIQVDGNNATVPVRLLLTYRDAQGQSQQETLSNLWVLKNMGGDWMLTRVRANG